MTDTISSQRVDEFTDAVSSDAPTPGGGAVAGIVAGLGAALVGMAGRYAHQHDPESVLFPRLVDRSDQLRARAAALADADAEAYGHYLQVSRSVVEKEARRKAIRAALDEAAAVPYELGVLAAEIADAGEQLATSGYPGLRSDACAAALLASAVAASAAILVEVNLGGVPSDPRIADSVQHASDAKASADRAVAAHTSVQKRVTT
jgi:formiminotetrahydrofolate cyclodeaminase